MSFLYHLDGGKNISHSFKVNCELFGLGNETVTLGPLVLLVTHLVWTFNKTQSSSSLGSEARLPSTSVDISLGQQKFFAFSCYRWEAFFFSFQFCLLLNFPFCFAFYVCSFVDQTGTWRQTCKHRVSIACHLRAGVRSSLRGRSSLTSSLGLTIFLARGKQGYLLLSGML